jgi:cobalt-zinc-cadmium efflux system protein
VKVVNVLSRAAGLSLRAVRTRLESLAGVESIHDLHVWTVTSGMVALSAHAIVRESSDHQSVLNQAHDLLQTMGIQHVTIQLECEEMSARELHLHP